jgi:hypothetical protein
VWHNTTRRDLIQTFERLSSKVWILFRAAFQCIAFESRLFEQAPVCDIAKQKNLLYGLRWPWKHSSLFAFGTQESFWLATPPVPCSVLSKRTECITYHCVCLSIAVADTAITVQRAHAIFMDLGAAIDICITSRPSGECLNAIIVILVRVVESVQPNL